MIRIRSGDTVTELAWTGENIPAARLLAQAGLYPDYPCGGQGRCGKCRVLAHGDLSPAAPEELAQLPPQELARGVRLACLARICGPDAELTLLREDGLLVETGGSLHRLEWDPWAAALGICVDIGTTTVAAYLWDLDRRCRLGVASCKNPQERFGADVVSRLDASLAGQGDALRACIVRCLSDLAYQLCRQAGRPVSDVGGAVITGNTAMLSLLRGYDVRDIALAPFQARHLFGESVPARELGLDWGADCQVYLPPCLSAYVGADITCGLLACDILHARGPALLADVGTNGEMALLSDGTIYCCATAAGPAFEGVGISCGSAAVTGAIDAVTVENNALRCHVIGGGTARSLCGSGLLDAVAALRRLELVDGYPRVVPGQYVAQGQVLVSGMTLSQYERPLYSHAQAEVLAEVEKSYVYTQPLHVEPVLPQAVSKSYYKLYLPWGELSLYAQLDVPENASQRVLRRPAAPFGFHLPALVEETQVRQAAAVPFDLTPGLAEDIARSRILDAIRAEFGDYELLEETPSAEEADGAVTLTLRVRMLADIGKMVPYEGEAMEPDSTIGADS